MLEERWAYVCPASLGRRLGRSLESLICIDPLVPLGDAVIAFANKYSVGSIPVERRNFWHEPARYEKKIGLNGRFLPVVRAVLSFVVELDGGASATYDDLSLAYDGARLVGISE